MLVPYGGNARQEKASVLSIKITELCKEYTGKDRYSGKELNTVKKLILDLWEKKYLIQYDRKRKTRNQTVTDRIEDYQSLIHVMEGFGGLTPEELKKNDNGNTAIRKQKGKLIIVLNPLLTDQINSKYVKYPSDINKRTMIAAGGALKITESINDLRDYLLREKSAKRYSCPINEKNLITKLRLTTYAESGRKKLTQKRIDDAINACKKLHILEYVKKEIGAEGQIKYTFLINKKFK